MTPASSNDPRVVFRQLVARRDFALLCVCAVIVNCVLFFLADWIPLYLKAERGFSFGVGNMLSIVIYAGLDLGNLASGLLVRRLVIGGRTLAQARSATLWGACLLMSAALAAGWASNRYIAVAALALTGLGTAGFQVIYLTLAQDLNSRYVGAVAGLLGGLGNLAYGLLSPSIGRIADLHASSFTFAVIGLMPWIALICILPVVRAQNTSFRPN